MKKTLLVLSFILLASFVSADQAEAPATDQVIIRVGEVEVTQSEFEALIASLPPEYQTFLQQPGGLRSFAGDFVEMKVLAIEAERSGVADDPEVATQLRLVRDNTLASAMVTRVEASMVPDNAQIEARYEEKKAELEQVRARHILIAFEGSPAAREDRTRTEDEAKALAERIRADIVGGADFAELAKTESDDTFSGAKGGDLGAFSRGQMVAEFENAAFGGSVGEVSEVVRTQFGYHIIEVVEHSTRPIEEVSEELRAEIVKEMLQSKLKEMTSQFVVTYDDVYFGPAAKAPGEGDPVPAEGER